MLAYQSASAVVFVCPTVKVSAWALANGALAKANARTSLFNILDHLCVHSTRRDDPRTRAGSIRSAVRQGKVQAKAPAQSGAECPSFSLGGSVEMARRWSRSVEPPVPCGSST